MTKSGQEESIKQVGIYYQQYLKHSRELPQKKAELEIFLTIMCPYDDDRMEWADDVRIFWESIELVEKIEGIPDEFLLFIKEICYRIKRGFFPD
jgi:predicted RecB family nuclease